MAPASAFSRFVSEHPVWMSVISIAFVSAVISFQAWLFERLIELELIDVRFVFTLEAGLFLAVGGAVYYLYRKIPQWCQSGYAEVNGPRAGSF